jgi:hypothetical protein
MRVGAWNSLVGLALACALPAVLLAFAPPVADDALPPALLLTQAKDKEPPKKEEPKKKDGDKKATPPDSPRPPERHTPPENDAFAQAPTRGGEAPSRGFNPHMLGDYQGLFARRFVTVPATQTVTTVRLTPQVITVFVPNAAGVLVPVKATVNIPTPVTFQNSGTVTVPAAVPITGLGAFKIAENEGPSPDDRVYLTYNYYSGIRGPAIPGDLSTPVTQTSTLNGQPAVVTTQARPFAPFSNANREVFGVERSFFDGAFSLGLRLPLVEQQDGSFANVGDLTGVFKYAPLRDPTTGSVLSVGLAATAPTGPSVLTTAGDIHTLLLQPFLGYRVVGGDCFVQGFTSISVPSNADFPALLFNDIGVGAVVYRGPEGAAITTVAPVVEAHLTTPLSGRGATSPLLAPDLLVLVGGVQVGVFGPSTLTLGVGAPVTGPRAFDIEGIVQLNFRF